MPLADDPAYIARFKRMEESMTFRRAMVGALNGTGYGSDWDIPPANVKF